MGDQQGTRTWRLPGAGFARGRAARGQATAAGWRAIIQSRLFVCAAVFAVWALLILGRLVYLQVFQHSEMTQLAALQQVKTITAPAKRGDIIDRNGHVLAYSVDADTVFADPTEVDDPRRTAELVCRALDRCDRDEQRRILSQLTRSKTRFAYVARKVSLEEARRIRELALPGIALTKESRRYYPKRELLAHVLGYVGLDNKGLAGLEAAYDAQVRGREGKVLIHVDARKHVLASRVERPATSGVGLELTVDQYLQHIAERELRAGVEENRAAGGTAVIMEPVTGEILALANWPTFNPNAYNHVAEEVRRNRAVQEVYEPGSTFKMVTASAALEEGVVDPSDPIDCSPGYITFPGRKPIYDVHRYGVLSFTDVVVKSSNVGAIRVGQRLGSERLGRYISRFGFGQAIAPDFRGESPGIVWNPARLDASALGSVSMGYQISVTPMQMAAAVSAVANGGTLYEPRVVRAFVRNGRRIPVEPRPLRRSISERTAAELTGMMESVVERGTAKAAQIEGYTIAGKTGTASKVVDGRYSRSDYNASFVGFVPSRRPALTIVVVIDSPKAKGYYGGTVAAPIFRRIAEAALRHRGIGPTINPVPPVLVARGPEAADGMAARPVRAASLDRILEPARSGLMPDLRGLSAREAVRTLTTIGMTARLSGDGFVVEQSIDIGRPIVPGDVCVLKLGRRPPSVAAGDLP